MDTTRRAALGALGGAGRTDALTAFRKALAALGAVETSAPEQVVERLEELGLLDGWSSGSRRLLAVAAHLGYGVGTGMALGLLRREREDPTTEAAVGAALGILSWGVGWTSLLPLLGVHQTPWEQRSPRGAVLPIVDHAVYGTVWGLLNRTLRSKDD